MTTSKISPQLHRRIQYLNQFFVDEKLKVSYCRVPKTGLTTWREILRMIHNVSVPKKFNQDLRHVWIHFFSETKLSKPMIKYNMSFWNSTAYKGNLNVLFARHPFERLLSAYLDKIGETARKLERIPFRKRLLRCMKCNNGCIYENGKFAIPFPVYVDAILYHKCRDEHWLPIVNLCFPCTIRYDYFVKLDTFQYDVECLREAMKALNFPRIGHYNERNTTDSMNHYFSQLSSTQIKDLWKYYYIDHLMFDYKFLDFGKLEYKSKTTNRTPVNEQVT